MDERLEEALKFANYRHTLFLEKQRLQEKLKTALTFGYGGGTFFLDRNFIVYLNAITPEEGVGSAMLLDDKLNPVYIDNLDQFRSHVMRYYNDVVNQYYLDIEALKKKRTVKAIVDL